jgi:hypothetical protein
MKQQSKESISMSDENMILVRYMHPNRGQHPVRGQATKTFYGYRSGGQDSFLVHREDIRLQPHLFQVVENKPTHVANEPAPLPVQEFDAEAYIQKMRNKWTKELDLQSLPGVTAKIAISMKNSGFTTRDDILRVGATGLEQAVNGIGQAKAEMIIAYLESVDTDGVG